MSDILLIQPPIEDFYLTAKRTMPYGLACIAGALRAAGFSVSILDGLATTKSRVVDWPEEMHPLRPFYGRSDRSPFALWHALRHYGYSLGHIAEQARASGAFLIGISSLFSAYSDMALQTAAAVRKACPRAVIVLGGHHPTALPEAVMGHPAVDYVVRGDGEWGLPPLARALRSGTGLAGLPGLVRRTADGGLEVNPPAMVMDLHRMPLPAFDLIHWPFYRRAHRSSLALSASRGCALRCTYCSVNAASHHPHRRRSVQTILAEVAAADAIAPIGFLDFEDEHLCADPEWFMALLSALEGYFADRKVELRAMNGLLASSLDERLLAAMSRAGFKTLNLALITTCPAQLRRFQRPDVTDDLDRVLASAPLHHLDAVAYLIVAGPGQDPRASIDDLLFLAQRRVLAGVSVFYPAPGSADHRWCRRRGLLPEHPGLLRATTLPLSHTTTRLQAVTLLRLGRILNFMKHLVDAGQPLPAPAPPPVTLAAVQDRTAVGIQLLAAFLHDGRVWGVGAEGQLFAHRIDRHLARYFLHGLSRIRLSGRIRT